ncbi:MAG TPA: ABC transporter permease [Ardenticatenaceae bacterium]|jgi:ABC-2 type transport system permease protein
MTLQTVPRTFKAAAWLGWQIESNWTDPFLFFAFSIMRPIASVLILVFMYNAVSQVGVGDPIYAYIYLGNAFYIYVGAVMAGASYSILDDRERYRMLKYLYIAPINMPVYLFGRAVARFIIGTLAVVITIAAGVLFFDVPVDLAAVNWPMFLAALMLGVVALTFMGIVIGMWTMTLRTEPWFLGEGVAAALYLFSGAIFPITLLPQFLQPIGFILPMTYWLELLRRALLGPGAAAFPTLAGFSNAQLFVTLFGITLLFGLIAAFAYRYFDLAARDAGMIDSQNNF